MTKWYYLNQKVFSDGIIKKLCWTYAIKNVLAAYSTRVEFLSTNMLYYDTDSNYYTCVLTNTQSIICTMYPFCPSRMTWSSSPSLVLIHLMPCSCGSIISGHRSALVKMVAFSIDMRSLGRFSLFHRAIVAPSVSRKRTSKPWVIGMGTCGEWQS